MRHLAWKYVGPFLVAVVCLQTPALRAEPSLFARARSAHWTGGYLKEDDSVRTVAETGERRAALEILRTHERGSEVRLRVLAQALRYEHAIRLGVDEPERARLRDELRIAVEDKDAPAFARNEACRVLLSSDWPERDAWYETLLADPTLRSPSDGVNIYSPLGIPVARDPQRWVPRLIPLLAKAGVVRSTVAHILARLTDQDEQPPRRDIAVALLPWLFDHGWAEDVKYSPSPRAGYITSLGRITIKEAVPGLIHVIETEHNYVAARAASALVRYRDPRALPALRKGLTEHMSSEWEREAFLEAISTSGGVSTQDGVRALEAYARLAMTRAGLQKIDALAVEPQSPSDAQLGLGIHLARDGTDEELLVAAVIDRVNALRTREPRVARALEAPLFVWAAAPARKYVVSRLADEQLDAGLLRRALVARNLFSTCCGDELRRLVRAGGLAAGRAVAVLEDPAEAARILRERDDRAILGLLRAALASDSATRDEDEDSGLIASDAKGGAIVLPIAAVGPLLAHENAAVGAAARSWLANEGGPTAQAYIKSRGQPVALPPAEAPHYRIAGVAPGMTREEARRAGPQRSRIEYSNAGRVVTVAGSSLQDGARALVSPKATAADVRLVFGRPDKEGVGHVVGTLGGYVWQYQRGSVTLVFAFADDRFTLGRKAALFQITLHDTAELQRRATTP